jgi:echinoderm microtubule-associated protein-like 1/2
LIYVW